MPLRYQSMCFTRLQWDSKGVDMNWHTLFTQKEMPGRVRFTYYGAPTIDLYMVRSDCPFFQYLFNFEWLNIGVETPFLRFCRRSLIYLDFLSNTYPFGWYWTSITRKYFGIPSIFRENFSCTLLMRSCRSEEVVHVSRISSTYTRTY